VFVSFLDITMGKPTKNTYFTVYIFDEVLLYIYFVDCCDCCTIHMYVHACLARQIVSIFWREERSEDSVLWLSYAQQTLKLSTYMNMSTYKILRVMLT
jgi:hypothetical protein